MSVNINHQLEQVNNLKITTVGSGATVGSAGIVTYYGDGSQLTGISAGGSSPWITTGYTGIGTTSAVGIGTRIEILPYDTQNNGTLSFEGSAGQLFSITNDLTTGSIFSVNDVSGIPSIDVDADGTIQLAPFGATEFVGIGTTNPTAKLDVNGTVALGSSVYDTNGTFGGNGQVLSNVTGFGVSWTTVSGGSAWSTSGNDIYYTTGKVGINSASPVETLDVAGTVHISKAASTFSPHLELFAENSFGGYIIAKHASSYPDLVFASEAGGGNTPLFKGVPGETVGSQTRAGISLQDNRSIIFGTGNDAYIGYDPTPGVLDISTVVSEPITFGTNETERVRITSAGDVGIGFTQPIAKLAVHGTLNISGISTFNNHVNLGDNDELRFGDDNDAKIEVDGSANFVIQGDSNTYLRGSSVNIGANGGSGGYGSALKVVKPGGGTEHVELYNGGNLKLETTSDGVTVTGILTATTFSGSGASLTAVDADTLDTFNSTQFLRSDFADQKTVGDLRFNNNIGITFGGSDNSRLFHDGTDLSLDLTAYVTDFKIRDNTTERYTFTKSGKLSLVNVNASGIVTANSFVKSGGTSSQYLMADGSVSTGGGGGGGASAINDLSDAITTGESVGLGTGTLVSDDGSTNRNTAIGHNSLNATTTGQRNVAMGYSAGYAVDTGTNLVLLGAAAGEKLTSQSGNVFIGEGSGQGVIGQFANANVAVGRNSLGRIGSVTAGGSVAIGENCLVAVTDGFYNVGIGYEAGDQIDTGNNNVCIGRQAGDEITSGDNNICIGYGSSASSSTVDNEITLGNDDITKFRIPGINVVLKDNGGTPTQGHVLTVDGSGEASFAAASGGGGGGSSALTTLAFLNS